MILKNPTNEQVGPYNYKGTTYGPIPAQSSISGVPEEVATWIQGRIHEFLLVKSETKIEASVSVKEPEATVEVSADKPQEVKAEIKSAAKPKAK